MRFILLNLLLFSSNLGVSTTGGSQMKEAMFPATEEEPEINLDSPPPDKVIPLLDYVLLLIARGKR